MKTSRILFFYKKVDDMNQGIFFVLKVLIITRGDSFFTPTEQTVNGNAPYSILDRTYPASCTVYVFNYFLKPVFSS